MKKTIIPSLLLLIVVAFQSCYSVVEDIQFNKDGSGTVKLIINMSESKKTLTNVYKNGGENTHFPPKADVQIELSNLENILKKTEGLTAVSITEDWTNFIFTIKGKFKDVKALNKAINSVGLTMNRSNIPFPVKKNFEWNGKIFERKFDYPIDVPYKDIGTTEKVLLEKGTFTTIHRFPYRIKKVSNKAAKISRNRTAVMYKTTFDKVVKKTSSPANTVELIP